MPKMMRSPGIEPGSTAWKATMLTITPATQMLKKMEAGNVHMPSSPMHSLTHTHTHTHTHKYTYTYPHTRALTHHTHLNEQYIRSSTSARNTDIKTLHSNRTPSESNANAYCTPVHTHTLTHTHMTNKYPSSSAGVLL